MALGLAYDDTLYTAMGALITHMKSDLRVPAAQRGYWTEFERVLALAGDPPAARLVMDCLGSFEELLSKLVT